MHNWQIAENSTPRENKNTKKALDKRPIHYTGIQMQNWNGTFAGSTTKIFNDNFESSTTVANCFEYGRWMFKKKNIARKQWSSSKDEVANWYCAYRTLQCTYCTLNYIQLLLLLLLSAGSSVLQVASFFLLPLLLLFGVCYCTVFTRKCWLLLFHIFHR